MLKFLQVYGGVSRVEDRSNEMYLGSMVVIEFYSYDALCLMLQFEQCR